MDRINDELTSVDLHCEIGYIAERMVFILVTVGCYMPGIIGTKGIAQFADYIRTTVPKFVDY